MTILQAGVPKSGNYWLYCIIANIRQQAGLKHYSFIQQHPIQEQAKNWQLGFTKQTEIDFLTITARQCYFRLSSVFRKKIPDIDSYINSCSQIWTHSAINSLGLFILPKFDKIIYIIRDPRDVAISYSKFAFTEHKLKHGPFHYEKNPQAYLENRLEETIRQWVQHVGSYLKYRSQLNIYPVFYERLLHSFDRELERLLAYLEIELSQSAIAEIKDRVAFNTMKQQSPNHLRKGSSGQWQTILSDRQKERVQQLAAPMLEILGYPLTNSTSLPSISDCLEPIILDKAIAITQYSPLDRVRRFYDFLSSHRSISAKANLARDWSLGQIKSLI
jgi:aryl sulfotransferase